METKQHHYNGLTDAEVLASREKYGANILTPKEEESVWDKIKDCMHFWLLRVIVALLMASVLAIVVLPMAGIVMASNIWVGPLILSVLFLITYLVAYLGGGWDEEERKFDMDPLITILLAALILSGAISFYQGVFGGESGFDPYFEPVGIAVAVLLATGVAHWLENKNEKTFKSLNEVNDDTLVKVVRNNNVCQIARKEIVVGDIVLLSTGEEIPADCELLDALNLTVNESTLTGEPSCHKTTIESDFDKDAAYPSNHILKGTTIMEGYCTAKVLRVGDKTECGNVFQEVQVEEGEATPLSNKLDELADLITKASYIIAALIVVGRLVIYWYQGNVDFSTTMDSVDFVKYVLDSIMIAVTLIVVAVPEGLPMAVTLSLAFSMRRLMNQNTLPRTMHSCETMGATSVICTDKTGTLTQNKMQVRETFFNVEEDRPLSNDQFSDLLKECIAMDTTANLDFSKKNDVKAVGSPTEGAVLLWLNKENVNYLDIRESVEVLDRIPFSTELKYMATIVRSQVLKGKRVLYVVGAPEIVMGLSSVSNDERSLLERRLAEYQSKARRTLGFAYLELSETENVLFDGHVKTNKMKMLGVVAIEDPIRAEVPGAIRDCLNAGIKVKIVTGDTPGTAKEIGRQVGLWTENDTDKNILLGPDVAAMDDDELKRMIADVKIISRARPADKERVVMALKAQDEVVAVTGDGTNDAPALHVANVGLSMGDGTAVAKEASDMTIMDNSFSTIANAVMWGRSLYKNIKRFILFQMTVNVAACLIVLIGAFIGTESPLTVTQMLWVNLIMDTFAALALASLPPTRTVMDEKPRSVNEHILHGMGVGILGVGLIFTAVLLGILLLFQHTDVTSLWAVLSGCVAWGEYNGLSDYELGLFFTIFVMLQFWNMFNAKAFMTNGSAFNGISWKNTMWFIIITLVIFFGQIAMIEIPGVQEMFNVAEGGLSMSDWGIIIGGTSLVLWIGEIIRLLKRK